MDFQLDPVMARVLGCLMEKEMATPEYYPLTMSHLMGACNQKSNRDPVMALGSREIEAALDQLRPLRLAVLVSTADGRVPKYKQTLDNLWSFSPMERAVLCELLVRGPQTPGELKNRASRLCEIPSVGDVLRVLEDLENRPGGPFVVKLARQPGQKESRCAHLFSGPVQESIPDTPVTAPSSSPSLDSRVAALEAEMQTLKGQLGELMKALGGPTDTAG